VFTARYGLILCVKVKLMFIYKWLLAKISSLCRIVSVIVHAKPRTVNSGLSPRKSGFLVDEVALGQV
jgi:hypothetical protein